MSDEDVVREIKQISFDFKRAVDSALLAAATKAEKVFVNAALDMAAKKVLESHACGTPGACCFVRDNAVNTIRALKL